MADISVENLAKLVRTTPERLREQLEKANVLVKDEMISDQGKRQLLAYLRNCQSGWTEEKEQITLKKGKLTGFAKQSKKNQRNKKSVSVAFRRNKKLKADVKDSEVSPKQEISTPPISIVEDTPLPSQDTVSVSDKEILFVEPAKEEKSISRFPPVQDTLKSDEKKEKENARRDSKTHRHKRHYKAREELSIQESFRRKKKKEKHSVDAYSHIEHAFEKPTAPIVREVLIPTTITVADLAQKMSVKAAEVIKTMMGMGAMVTINQALDQETAVLVVEEMGHQAKPLQADVTEEKLRLAATDEPNVSLAPRPPVVTVMGHVDHGKTSLLDFIRRTRITSGEAGGITQHIGAYHVKTERGFITFLDTPGHEAFTAMRARGVKCTDIVVLVVAADDGVMPQTIEAIEHAKAASVPIIVAINKIDKVDADPDRIKTELGNHGLLPEDWGGDTIFQNISAKKGIGIDDLLEAILLQSEMLELKAAPSGLARGVVIESRLDKGCGPVLSVLITQGMLHKGDILLAGSEFGRVRAMTSDDGIFYDEAGPSIPVEILGLSGTANVGDEAVVVRDEKRAREIALLRKGSDREVRLAKQQSARLENVFDRMELEEEVFNLNIVLKTDVQGSLEAIGDALRRLSPSQVKINIVSGGVGRITESDAHLALASSAIIVGFNVRADQSARVVIERESIDLRYYSVIYHLVDELKQVLSGLLKPTIQEKIIGLALVRDVFRSSKFGAIAGCMVTEGSVKRNAPIRVLRDSVVIYEGELESLKRFKEDVSEVRHGMECGIGVKNYRDVRANDQIECYEKFTVKQSL